jgi:anti-sigma factor RsiW
MSHDDLDRLIQDRLDGRITAEDDARLRALLDRDPEARDCLDRANVLFEALHSMRLEDPPPDDREDRDAGDPAVHPRRWPRRVAARDAAQARVTAFRAG